MPMVNQGDWIRVNPNATDEDLIIPHRHTVNGDLIRGGVFYVTTFTDSGNPVIDTSQIGVNGYRYFTEGVTGLYAISESAIMEVANNDVNDTNCSNCGRDFESGEYMTLTGEGVTVCYKCRDSEYDHCGNCNRYTHLNSFINTRDGNVCPTCYESTHFQCSHCNDYFHTDHRVSRNDDEYCQGCFDLLFFRCEECGATTNQSEEHNFRGMRVDSHCYARLRRRGMIAGYHAHDPVELFGFGEPDSTDYSHQFYMGVEMEYECSNDCHDSAEQIFDDLDGWAFMSHDGSLNNGFEIVTRPTSQADLENKFGTLFDKRLTSNIGLKVKNHTGLHINVSRQAFTDRTALALANMIVNNFDDLTESVAGRAARGWCEKQHKYFDRAMDEAEGGTDKYTAMNIKDRVVEFRVFKATTHPVTFHQRLQYVRAVIDYANQCSREEKLPELEEFQERIANEDQWSELRMFLPSMEMDTEEIENNNYEDAIARWDRLNRERDQQLTNSPTVVTFNNPVNAWVAI